MDDEKVRALLSRLHEELRSADSGDPATRDVVDQLSSRIRPMVIGSPESPSSGDYSGLTGKLKAAAIHFEASHPSLARSIEAVVDNLGSYGI
ncbi:MAG: DUF4404 family protein [Gemmatimonadota bacterium]